MGYTHSSPYGRTLPATKQLLHTAPSALEWISAKRLPVHQPRKQGSEVRPRSDEVNVIKFFTSKQVKPLFATSNILINIKHNLRPLVLQELLPSEPVLKSLLHVSAHRSD